MIRLKADGTDPCSMSGWTGPVIGTDRDNDGADERLYYRGLALQQLGRAKEAATLFTRLVERGKERLARAGETDFFAKFGEGELPHVRKAAAHYLAALGHLGLGENEAARTALNRAVELDVSHTWTQYYLAQLDG